MENLISIIIPVYKSEVFLNKCLDSIINQTYKNIEIILVNDGSPDNSGKICDQYAKKDERIKVIHKENGGVSSARNLGLKNATGKYITFVDSDDWIEPDMYECMIKKLQENNVDMVRCSYYKEDGEKVIDSHHAFNEDIRYDLNSDFNRENILNLLITGEFRAFLWLILVKREFIESIKEFNTNVAMREDLIWMVELMCVINSIYICTRPFYHYYQNPNSATNSPKFKERNLKNMLIAYDEIYFALERHSFMNENIKSLLAFSFFYRISSDLTTLLFDTRNIELLDYMLNSKSFENMIFNVNPKDLSIVNKTFIYLYGRKALKLLYYFCLLREFVRKKC